MPHAEINVPGLILVGRFSGDPHWPVLGVFRTFGEGSLLLCTARTRHKLDQAACNTRIRSKSSLARPYI